jgi:D-3-phosphoglycerate dehydrogenase
MIKHPDWVLNTSRGKVVNTQDLVTALDQKLVLGAGLDVFEDEKVERYKQSPLLDVYNQLFAMENVVITPHVAGWTYESKYKLAAVLCDKIRSLS